MKGMPLPFDFEGKGFFAAESESESESSSSLSANPLAVEFNWKKRGSCYLGSEPTSVLETIRSPSPSPPTSTSTLSSSLGGGGGGGGSGGSADTAGVAAISGTSSQKWPQPQHETTTSSNAGVESGCGGLELPPPPEIGGGSAAAAGDKCGGMGMEDWESVLTESVAASPGQEQSILRWIMGDVEDPSMGLNKLLQSGGGPPPEFDFSGGSFGAVDQGFGLDSVAAAMASGVGGGSFMTAPINPNLPPSGFLPLSSSNKFTFEKLGFVPNSNPPNPNFSPLSTNLGPISPFNHPQESPNHQQAPFDCPDVKPPILNPQLLINQHQSHHPQNPSFFLPLPFAQQEQHHHLLLPPQAKRHNSGGLEIPKLPFADSGGHQDLFMGNNNNNNRAQPGLLPPHQLQLLPQYLQQQRPSPKPKMAASDNQHHQQQQAVIDQLYKAAELVPTGNSILAQEILARLNHQLSPIGKPFQRAAFYCKEALQLLLHTDNHHTNHSSPINLIYKIGAYKSFSEVSPFLQFANFTCNQALLEALEGFDRIHIVDFDIGYGGQWASLMQELALRGNGAPSLKITAFAYPSQQEQIELGLTRENLNHFANEINMAFEFEILSLDSLNSVSWSLPLHVSENEAIAVNLPVGSFPSYQLSLPSVLRFVKQLSPKIIVSVDRGCDRSDLAFPNHVIHTLQSYSNLLESLDAVHVNLDALQKIERFLIQPSIEKIVMGRYRSQEKTPHWRTLFMSSGLSPLTFSNFTESQAECVVKRTPVRGFHVEKRHSSLVLCWQRKELISASAWRC